MAMGTKPKPWEEIRIKSWAEFDKVVGKLRYRRWVYRGQSNASWPLNTSLYRAFEDASPIVEMKLGSPRSFARDQHENLLLERFQASAHLYRSVLPKASEKLEWLAIMQYFGAPTRLLDVTLSPHIATYFSLEEGHGDCCVFAFDHLKLRPGKQDPKSLRSAIFNGRRGQDSFILLYRPRMSTERLVAHQGLFLVPSNNYQSFGDILARRAPGGVACKKIIIPAKLRFDGIARLGNMNLTSMSLFPGIDGFCRSLRFQILEPVKSQRLIV